MDITSFRNRKLDKTKPVEVYKNIRRKDFSIRQGGYVVARASKVVLKDVTFVVQEAGRQKVLKTGCKNVHAWVKGRVCGVRSTWGCRRARYNPKDTKTFVDLLTGEALASARYAVLSAQGIFYGKAA